MANLEQIIADIKELKLLEVAELVKMMEEEFGVSAAAPVAVVAGGAVAEVEEKSEFDVVLANVGSEKIKVIKVVRELTGLGLVDAKKLVDNLPSAIKENVSEEVAKEVKEKLEAAGATVEVK